MAFPPLFITLDRRLIPKKYSSSFRKLCFLILSSITCTSIRTQDTIAISHPDTLSHLPKIEVPNEHVTFFNDLNFQIPLPADSVLPPEVVKRRVRLIAGVNIVGYSAAMTGLYAAWYSNYERTGFHAFDDSREWLQVDKIGHVYSAYAESLASMELWRWTGIDRKKRIWLGGMSGAMYQTVIEVLDGFSEGWGWSWADFGANIIGSGTLVAQELAWDEQRIKLKFSFHRKSYRDVELNNRSDVLFGKGDPERYLKDYNGQTYWASVNIHSFNKNSKWPSWLAMAIGTGAEGLFGGTENIGRDDDGNINFFRPDVRRYRQWYLAPDIDLSKIKTNSKAIKVLLSVFNVFKFPAPALEFSKGRFKFHFIYF
jgi:uncharacterized protein YfiM (DUF2279 family)